MMILWLFFPALVSLVVVATVCIRGVAIRQQQRFPLADAPSFQSICLFCGAPIQPSAVCCRRCGHSPLECEIQSVDRAGEIFAAAAQTESMVRTRVQLSERKAPPPILADVPVVNEFDKPFADLVALPGLVRIMPPTEEEPRREPWWGRIADREQWPARGEIFRKMREAAHILRETAHSVFAPTLALLALQCERHLQNISDWRAFVGFGTLFVVLTSSGLVIWQSNARLAQMFEAPSQERSPASVEPAATQGVIEVLPPIRSPKGASVKIPAQPPRSAELKSNPKPPPVSTKARGETRVRAETNRDAIAENQLHKLAVSSDLVAAVQRKIRGSGYDTGLIDGIMGPRTRRAIRAYQRDSGLAATGEIDRVLLRHLKLI